MPPQQPRELDEKLPGEDELRALYRQLPHNEPGPALDAAVLRAAAQALADDAAGSHDNSERRKALGQPSHAQRRPRWLIPLSSAAAVVLAAGLAWRMHGLAPNASTSTPANSGAAMPASAPHDTSLRTRAPAAEMMSKPSPPPPPLAPRAPVAQLRVTEPTPPPRVTAPAAKPAPIMAERALPAPPKISAYAIQRHAAKKSSPVADQVEVPAPVAPSAPMAQSSAAPSRSAEDAAALSPAQQVEQIQQLFAQGHDQLGRQRLKAFVAAHPHWALPPELREKLPRP